MIAPLFIATLADLKKRLRLTGVKSGSDGEELLLDALLVVRRGLYDKLGLGLIAEIVAITYNDNPGTADEYKRALANLLEIRWTRLECMKTMPQVFMDASGDTDEIWNKEAAFRQGVMQAKQLVEMENQVQQMIDLLLGRTNTSGYRFSTIEADCPPGPIGSSVWRDYYVTYSTIMPEG